MTHREPRSMRLIIKDEETHDEALRDAIAAMRALGYLIDAKVSAEAGAAVQLAAQAVELGMDVVVAVGGDGTLNEVINGVYAASKSFNCGIGIVPHGTANDFAQGCNIPADPPLEALRVIAQGHVQHLDVGRANGKLFANVATGGFGAEVVNGTPQALKKLVGKLAYLLTGLATMGTLESRPARVRGEGFEWEGAMFSINIGNGGRTGGGLRVCPKARLDDGLLDALIVPDMPLRNAVTLYEEMRNNEISESDLVVYHQSPWFEIEAPGGIHLNLDGESHFGESFRFDLLPRAMPLYVPNR
jgi:lipid kinase YegS